MGFMTALLNPRSAVSESEIRGAGAWLQDMGQPKQHTASGIDVSEEKSLRSSAVFACVRVIAEDVAKLPLILYRRREMDGGEGKERARDLTLYRRLHLEPNPETTAFDFRQALTVSAVLWGNGYAEIQRDGAGRDVNHWQLLPWQVQTKRDAAGTLYYEVRDAAGQNPRSIAARDMIHVRGISVDGLVGYMMAMVAKESIGLGLAAMEFTAGFFGRGLTTSGVISIDGDMKPEKLDAYRRSVMEKFAGIHNSHKPLVFDQGAKFSPVSTDPEKSQLVDTLHFAIEDIARYFRVSPTKIGHLIRAQGWSTVEAHNLNHLNDALMPWLVRWEQELTRKLLPGEGEDLFVEHLVDALLRTDLKTRYEAYNTGINAGFLSRQEARAKENLNPLPGLERMLVPQNMAVLSDDGEIVAPANESSSDPPPAAGDDDDSAEETAAMMMPVFVDAAERVISRETLAVTGKKSMTDEWLTEFYAKHHEHVVAAFRAPIQTLARMVGADAAGIAERYADVHVAASLRELRASDDVAQTFNLWSIERPAQIAKTLTDEVCHAAE